MSKHVTLSEYTRESIMNHVLDYYQKMYDLVHKCYQLNGYNDNINFNKKVYELCLEQHELLLNDYWQVSYENPASTIHNYKFEKYHIDNIKSVKCLSDNHKKFSVFLSYHVAGTNKTYETILNLIIVDGHPKIIKQYY